MTGSTKHDRPARCDVIGTVSRLGMYCAAVVTTFCIANCGPSEEPAAIAVPDPHAFLNRSYRSNNGLADAVSDAETERYLAALPSVPATFEAWLTEFEFPVQGADESLLDYRRRANVVVYYNRNELALGRELGCNQGDYGIACYVTNYGELDDESRSMALTIDGANPRNTVAITYLKDMRENLRIQFYAYKDGLLRVVGLDSRGDRPLPHVCTNCHGGNFDAETSLTKYARFLPLDPDAIVFSNVPGYDRQAQEAAIWYINALTLQTPLSTAQRQALSGMYNGDLSATPIAKPYTPEGWLEDTALYQDLVKPFCLTCHFAEERAPDGELLSSHTLFDSADEFKSRDLSRWVCSGEMPNAEPTLREFWRVLEERPDYASMFSCAE